MATSKPDIMIILLSKLMEEGDMFYKVRGGRSWFLKAATDCSLHVESAKVLTVSSLALEAKGGCHPSVIGS